MPSNLVAVDFVLIGALTVLAFVAFVSKAKVFALSIGAVILLITFVMPISQTHLLDVKDPNERLNTGEKAYDHGGPAGRANVSKVLIGVGVTLGLFMLLAPGLKKQQKKKNEELDARVKTFMGNHEMEVWETSFNSARINASQNALEMAFKALETAVGAGMDNPQWIEQDAGLQKLRQKDQRRFDNLVYKASKTQARNAKKKK
jgi:hypothetical protein